MTTEPSSAAPLARSWGELADVVHDCVACPELAAARINVVPGLAPPGAQLLLIGEAPGAQEDSAGVPFVGRSGQLLDTLLAEAGLPRERVAIVNVLKCRPPGNRKPRRAEVQRCRPWLVRQIELLDPLALVTLGGTAAEWAFGSGARIAALRDTPTSYAGRPVVVTYHPSAAIRFGPNGQPMAALREDLKRAAVLVEQLLAGRSGG